MSLTPRRAILTAAFLLNLAGSLPAADPPPSIDKLVEQLGSPRFPVREQATKALRERGPDALPALRKALTSSDEEVRKRAETLIPGLEIEEALLPKRVTLKVTDAPLTDLLRDIEKQTGQKVSLGANKAPIGKVTLDVVNVPLWDALEQMGKATGRGPSMAGYPNSLHLIPNARRSPFISIHGPFRLEATWFHEDRDVDLADVKPGADGWRNHRLTLAVSVLTEPRLTLLQTRPAKVDEALDSDGQSLVEPADATVTGRAQQSNRGTFRGEHLHSADVRLRRASPTAKTAKVIRGTIPVKAVLIRKPVVVSNKVLESAGTTFKAGTESLAIRNVQNQGGGNVNIEVLIPWRDTSRSPDQEWYDRFKLEDEAGNRFQMNGRGSSYDGREYRINMYFSPPFNNRQKVGAPTRFIFEDWVVHEHAIPFEFRDVPLP